MATGVHVRPQPFPVGATAQVSESRSASPAQWVKRGREVVSRAALASGAVDVHDRGADIHVTVISELHAQQQ